MYFKGIKFQRSLRFGCNLIPFPVDKRRRFNVCLTSHNCRIEVETTWYVYRVKVKHRL